MQLQMFLEGGLLLFSFPLFYITKLYFVKVIK